MRQATFYKWKAKYGGMAASMIKDLKAFARGKNHINGIENFWNQAKKRRRKYNGIPHESFELFLIKNENLGFIMAHLDH